jgi:putative transport protein
MVTAVRTGQVNRIPAPEVVLGANDVLLLASKDKAALEEARTMLGEHAPGALVEDRSNIDYVRVFASKRNVVGLRLSDLTLPDGMHATIVQVRRGDADLLATPDLILEFGDRVGLFANRKHFPGIRKFFGDSIKGTTEFSYISTGIGMVLGVILGVLPVPVPGLGTISLGLAGGPLIIALILGKLGRTGGLTWTMPLSANLTLRNFGLTVFLAQVGMSSGPKFVATVQQTGFTMLFIGVLIVFVLVLATLLIGHYLMRIPFDDLLGITAGVTGNPAILAHAARSVPTDRPDIGYAMIFPGATIVKIIIVQLLVTLAAR